MNTQPKFDERTLSAYIDGELDLDTMSEVETLLEQDEKARHYILNAVKTSAYLRSSANAALEEEVPDRLLDMFSPPQSPKRQRRWSAHPLYSMAAVLLVLIGMGTGLWIELNGNSRIPAMMLPLPDRYHQIVNETLEHNISGASKQWREPQISSIITVTPVRTYRDQNGLYYREYRMEVATDTDRNQVKGLAYRDANGDWKTKALYF
jgi:hypothetical protein